MRIFDILTDCEDYCRRFKGAVLFDFYTKYVKDGARTNEMPYRPKHEPEAKYMTKATNDIHRKLIGDLDVDGLVERIISKSTGDIDRDVAIQSIFAFLDASYYRFENYFDDYRIIYPFDSRRSEEMFDIMDSIASEVAFDRNRLAPYEQASKTFVLSLQYILKKWNVIPNSAVWKSIMNTLGISERSFVRGLAYGRSININQVLRASFHFEIHPYQFLGLRRIDYNRVME